jgi:hypothetical protein
MARPGKHPQNQADYERFAPRVTISLLAGFALFLLLALLYSLPAILEPPPPDAIADYTQERVRARLEGKVFWIFAVSMLAAALAGVRGILPFTRRRP